MTLKDLLLRSQTQPDVQHHVIKVWLLRPPSFGTRSK